MANVGDIIEVDNASWTFSGAASERFDQHARRSIPFYEECHELICEVSDFFVHPGSRCYDLGCSTGTLLQRLASRHATRGATFIGLDNEPDMIALARQRNEDTNGLEFELTDIVEFEFGSCDLMIAAWTIQFVPPKFRQQLLNQLYESLNWGGGLLIFDKVRAPDARFQDMITTLYNDYKLSQGYDGNEIVHKTRSLKGVLEPFSRAGNLGLLERAGFVDVTTVFKYLCFEGFLAIK